MTNTIEAAQSTKYSGTFQMKELVTVTTNEDADISDNILTCNITINNTYRTYIDGIEKPQASLLYYDDEGSEQIIETIENQIIIGETSPLRFIIPSANDKPEFFNKKISFYVKVELPGLETRIQKVPEYDYTISLTYSDDGTDNFKPYTKNIPLVLGNELKFKLEYNRVLMNLNSYHQYLLIFEEDINDPQLSHYISKINNNKTAAEIQRIDIEGYEPYAAALLSSNKTGSFTWENIGLHGKEIVLGGKETGGSPDQYEWSVILLLSKNDIQTSENNFIPFSERESLDPDDVKMVIPYFDYFICEKPNLKESFLVEHSSKPKVVRNWVVFRNEVTTHTVKGSIIFEHINITRWIEALVDIPKEMLKLVFPSTM